MKHYPTSQPKRFAMALALALSALLLPACAEKPDDVAAVATPAESKQVPRTAFVHLFEWRWPDIARECEDFIGPAGYAAAQVSPPQEHVPGPQWWTRYQPVSYKIISRGGTREEFADMVQRCKVAGVDIYVDAIINHMARAGTGTGITGVEYTEYSYPVPYAYDEFHHCGRHGDDGIRDFEDLWEIHNCELVKLADLDTGNPTVQAKIAAYLNDLLSLGVSGFRLDAAKHMAPDDIAAILALLESPAFVFQEVIDRGSSPISGAAYVANGRVTEFKFPIAMVEAFEGGHLESLASIASRPGYISSDDAVVFVDNHDVQRGHAGADHVLNFKDSELYDLANIFMLAWPYGYPKIMSSYEFEDSSQGPPESRPVPNGGDKCDAGWVCEHRRPAVAAMVEFRNATDGTAVSNWQAVGETLIAFGRGDAGHVVINIAAETVGVELATGMAAGDYCDIITHASAGSACEDDFVHIDEDGVLRATVGPLKAVAILARSHANPRRAGHR